MKNKKESPLGTAIPKRARFPGNAHKNKTLNHQGITAMLIEKPVEGNPISIEFLNENTPAVSSLDVARHFGKPHKNVLRDIDNIIRNSPKSFHGLNFERMFIEVKIGNGATRKDPAYLLTRDAFMLLAMGFTGSAALRWKLKYIEAFNALEAAVLDNIRTDALDEANSRIDLARQVGYRQGVDYARALPASESDRKAAYLDGMKEGQRLQKRMLKRKDGLATLERALSYQAKGVNLSDTAKLVGVPATTLRGRMQRLRRFLASDIQTNGQTKGATA